MPNCGGLLLSQQMSGSWRRTSVKTERQAGCSSCGKPFVKQMVRVVLSCACRLQNKRPFLNASWRKGMICPTQSLSNGLNRTTQTHERWGGNLLRHGQLTTYRLAYFLMFKRIRNWHRLVRCSRIASLPPPDMTVEPPIRTFRIKDTIEKRTSQTFTPFLSTFTSPRRPAPDGNV